MASIDKLSIRGIRSFSPNHEEVIEFYHPLTVILGDNGSGKTTIIESLKMACTGSLPPGARSGQSFIHDPRIAGTNEVKASVKLRFRNRAGKPMVVQRTFQLQQQKSGAKFKALDGAIRVKNDLGENVSMSHKCAELDRHIPEMLGVSKAILESVIFCHQEESNWPLLEGAVLKKRFDDIFESARYTKALDAIRKLKKARGESAKDFNRDLTVLNVKLKGAQEISEKIEAGEEKLHFTAEEASSLDNKIEQAKETLDELNRLLEEVKSEYEKLDRCQNDFDQKELNIQAAYQRIEKMMSDSDNELEKFLLEYDTIVDDKRHALKSLEDEKSQLEIDVSEAQKTYINLQTEKGFIEAKIEEHQLRVTELIDLIAETGKKYQFSTLPVSSQTEDITAFFSKFQTYIGEKVKALEQVEALNRQGDDLLNSQLSEVKSKLHHTTQELKAKQLARGNLNTKKRENAAKVKELALKGIPSVHDVTEAMAMADEAQKALQAFKENHNFLSLKAEIVEVNRQISEVEFEIKQHSAIVNVLREKEQEHIALEAKRQGIREKQDGFHDKLADLAIEYRALLDGETPTDESSFATALDHLSVVLTTRKGELEQKQKQGLVADRKLQECEFSSKRIEETLASLRLEMNALERGPVSELKRCIEEISPHDDLQNAEEIVKKAEKAYFAAKDKTLRCKNTITFLSIFKEKGTKDKCCPLCVRNFSPHEEEIFVKTINEKTDDKVVKSKIKKAEAAEESALKKWKSAENALPSWRKWKLLEAKINETVVELDSLYASQRGLQADSKEKKAQIEKAQLQVSEAEEAYRAFLGLQNVTQELSSLRIKVATDEESLRCAEAEELGANAPSLRDALVLLEEKEAKLKELNRQLSSKQTDLQDMQDKQYQLQNNVHKRKEEKLRLDELRKEYDLAVKEQGELRDKEKSLVDEMSALESTQPDLLRDIEAKNFELQRYRDEASERLLLARNEEQHCKLDFQSLEEKWRKVEAQASQNLTSDLKRLGERIAQIKQSETTAAKALEDLSPQIVAVTNSLVEEESMKRHIRDNLEYRGMKKDLEELRAQLAETAQRVSALPPLDEVSRHVRAANATLNSLKEERATLRGQQQQLEVQIREEKIKLKSADYRNIEERHRQKLIQYETTLMAVSDLDKYYKALDQSLLQFHSKKVEEINSIIKSLWQITYKGQDIDTIEVISGQELDTGGTKAARSYDYRVVMKKGGALIDMRGRCSAGQKVLAALVIRLALAETFCLNCGILALDEPTTNLDTENKLGLAQAITDILNARSGQQNFQLVCITHDEEFVRMLSEAQAMDGSCPEYYWRVSREDIGNNRFCSRIERREWRDGA